MTQPKFAPIEHADEVRPAYELEPAAPWFTHRPGEYRHAIRPSGKGLGVQGPDQGYALRLARGFVDRLVLAEGEYEDDVLTASVVIGLRRAASFGRAPVHDDIEVTLSLFGYLDEAPIDLVAYRRQVIGGIAHDYRAQRALANSIPVATLTLRPTEIHDAAAIWPELTGQLRIS